MSCRTIGFLTCASSVSAGYDDAQAGDRFQGDGHQQQSRGGYNNFLSRFNRRPNVVALHIYARIGRTRLFF